MSQRRPRPGRQQGFGLLAFVLATSIFALSLVFGYTGLWTKERQLFDAENKTAYVEGSVERVTAIYPSLSLRLDSTLGDGMTGETILDYAQVPRQWNLRLEKSRLLLTPEGYGYRSFVFWLDIPDDGSEPMDLAKFRETGILTCGADSACDPSYYATTWNSAEVVRGMMRETESRAERVAKKAQLYFKARQLQDPERNVSVNYFYKPNNVCAAPNSIDLGCLEDYTMLATIGGQGSMTETASTVVPSQAAEHLGLSPNEMVTAWNIPMEISAIRDAVSDRPPFTLAIRAVLPGGTQYIKKFAVQQF